jgi:hypothetical protein
MFLVSASGSSRSHASAANANASRGRRSMLRLPASMLAASSRSLMSRTISRPCWRIRSRLARRGSAWRSGSCRYNSSICARRTGGIPGAYPQARRAHSIHRGDRQAGQPRQVQTSLGSLRVKFSPTRAGISCRSLDVAPGGAVRGAAVMPCRPVPGAGRGAAWSGSFAPPHAPARSTDRAAGRPLRGGRARSAPRRCAPCRPAR